MGNNCSDHPAPNTTNQCSISQGGEYIMPGFCSYEGEAGNGYRNQFCSLMSGAGEWGNAEAVDNLCQYNDCIPYLDFGSGCCQGCCGIVGDGLQCERLTFTGNPVPCCFNDMNCTGLPPDTNPVQCYSDGESRQNTCDDGSGGNNYRNLVSPACQDVMFQYCTGTLPGDDPTSTAWLNRWTQNNGGKGSCSYVLARNLFKLANPCLQEIPIPQPGSCNISPPLPIDAEGYFWGQQLVSAAMAKYENQGFAIGTLPGFVGYNPWQDFLYSTVCCPYPGLCQSGLDVVCATKTSQRISLNPAVAQWCGCHLSPGEYADYSARFNIPPECTPMCNRVGTIPIVGINAEAVTCKQNICLIDDVTVNLINSQIGGGIDFNQICGNCQDAQCSCIVSNTTVDISNSTIGGNVVPVTEGCGSFTCAQTNPGNTGPRMLTVQCEGTGSFNPYAQYEAEVAAARATAKKNAWLWTLIAIGIALVLIFIIIFVIDPGSGIVGSTIVSPTMPPPVNTDSPVSIQSLDNYNVVAQNPSGDSNLAPPPGISSDSLGDFTRGTSEFNSISS